MSVQDDRLKICVRRIVENRSDGRDIDELFLRCREYARSKHPKAYDAVKDIGDFIAHATGRDQGACLNILYDLTVSSTQKMKQVQKLSCSRRELLEGLDANSRLKLRQLTGKERERYRSYLGRHKRKFFDKLDYMEDGEIWTKSDLKLHDKVLYKDLIETLTFPDVYSQGDIIQQIASILSELNLIDSLEDITSNKVATNSILLGALARMHLMRITHKDSGEIYDLHIALDNDKNVGVMASFVVNKDTHLKLACFILKTSLPANDVLSTKALSLTNIEAAHFEVSTSGKLEVMD